jgi:hypothetical protein
VRARAEEPREVSLRLRNGVRPNDAGDIESVRARGFGNGGFQRLAVAQKSRSA